MVDVGQPAPDFELPNHDGETVRLSDFEGQRIVLYFYPKAGTEGCTIEARNFSDAGEEFQQHDIQVLGASTDTVAEIAAFKKEQDIRFPLLSDEDGAVARRYEASDTTNVDGETDVTALRNTYVIGPDGDIEAVYESVSPEDHAEQVLDDIADSK
jgi:peroxiredoxin Q/BCP